MDDAVSKRLHISGLTPAITLDDLSRRLGSFGTVRALDGLGKLDALGQPRSFAYVTLESTKSKLAKCMNLLSGSTWKGAKLRIGEAKPDYRERLALEREAPEEPPRKRTRLARGLQGRHAQDMSLVTKENAHLRPQWHVTALGRLIRPVRIRPDRPLDPPLETAVSKAKTKLGKDGKPMKVRERKRKREPPVRARRRTIDPLKWGSTHVQGVFLEGSMLGADGIARERVESSVEEESDGEEESDEEVLANETSVEDKEEDMLPEELTETPTTVPTESPSLIPSTPFPTLSSSVRQASALQSAPAASDLAEEKSRTLGLLQSIFGDADDDWGGVESVASDVDMDDLHEQPTTGGPADDWDVEFVPREKANVQPSRAVPDSEQEEDASEESDDDERVREEAVTAPTQTTKLKDLFKPQEDQAGFSLLGHLDLDLDFDLALDEQALTLPAAPVVPTAHTPAASTASASAVGLDPTLPLFFPRHVDHTWHTTFVRTGTEEDIRARWEATRGELTREWKRRHREAVKSRRRRGGDIE